MDSEYDINPFAPSKPLHESHEARRVSINPFELLSRAKDLVGEQYWLFVGIVLVAMLISSAVPMGLAMGPMMIGIFYCYNIRDRGGQAEFNDLFRGFDKFMEGLIATLVMVGAGMVVTVPLVILAMMIMFIPVAMQSGPGGADEVAAGLSLLLVFIVFPIVGLASMLIYVPFVFAFQLIADRDLTGWEAVKQSFQGAMRNFFGIVWMMMVFGFLNAVAALACYVPVFLLMPLTFGGVHLAYRDIYGYSDGKADLEMESPFR